jgi:hypothetical protein
MRLVSGIAPFFILAAAASTTQSKHAMTNNQINQPAELQS